MNHKRREPTTTKHKRKDRMSETKTTPYHKKLAEDRLAPIAAWARSNHGAISQLYNQMKVLAEKAGYQPDNVNRHMVGRWLKEEAAVQPSYGYGLLLEAAYAKLSAPSEA